MNLSFSQNITVFILSQLFNKLKPFIYIPLIIKTIGAYDYGTWIQFHITISLICAIIHLGLPFALTRFLPSITQKSEDREYFYSAFFTVLIMSISTCILVISFSVPISNFLFDGDRRISIILGIIIIAYSLIGLGLNYFRAKIKIVTFSFLSVCWASIEISFVVVFFTLYSTIYAAIIGYSIATIIFLIIVYSIIIYNIGLGKFSYVKLKTLLKFGLPTIPSNFSSWIIDSSDRYLITFYLGIIYVGLYSPIYSLGSIILVLIIPFGFLLTPVLSKKYDQGDIPYVRWLLSRVLTYFLFGSIPIAIFIFVNNEDILIFLSSLEIASYGNLVLFILISFIFLGCSVIYNQILVLYKQTKIIGIIWIVSAGINIVMNIILIPTIGIYGAGISTLVAFAFGSVSIIYISSKYISIETENIKIIGFFVIGLILIFPIMLIPLTGFYGILSKGFIYLGLYTIIIIYFKILPSSEVKMILRKLLFINNKSQ